jgi:hypothetical protein
MLQLCATLLNQADERSVSFIDFLTWPVGTNVALLSECGGVYAAADALPCGI